MIMWHLLRSLPWHMFSYIWRRRFADQGTSAALQYFKTQGKSSYITFSKNGCCFCDFDIALGLIVIIKNCAGLLQNTLKSDLFTRWSKCYFTFYTTEKWKKTHYSRSQRSEKCLNKLYIHKLLYTWKHTQLLFTISQLDTSPRCFEELLPCMTSSGWKLPDCLTATQTEALSTFSPLTAHMFAPHLQLFIQLSNTLCTMSILSSLQPSSG